MKRKTHFTRKNLIFLSLLFFFLVLQTFVLICMDTGAGIMKKTNPIAQLAGLFGFPLWNLGVTDYVTYLLIVFYTFVFAASVLYEVRLAKYYNERPLSKKYILEYIVTLLLCLLLSFGLSMLLQLPYSGSKFFFTVSMLWQTFLLGALIYLVLAGIIFAAFVLIVNFRNIDKPFRFFGKKEAFEEEEQALAELENFKKSKEESDLSSSLDTPAELPEGLTSAVGVAAPVYSASADSETLSDKEKIFPGLCAIDNRFEFRAPAAEDTEISLKDLCDTFRDYLAEQSLYFDIRTVREFVSAFSATRLVILEGLSGTGKSSLPRYFASFLGSEAFFVPVQATWRDRTSLVGYYNEFSKTFNETDFLKRLYQASYTEGDINLMVLDELNLSRIEYYFADFLSVMEYPSSEWKIHLMQLPYSFEAPRHIADGKVSIPENTFFVGTANKDDSTYTITDKVYDRAITIDFDDRNEPFETSGPVSPVHLSAKGLSQLYLQAQSDEAKRLSRKEYEAFKKLSDFTYDTFDVTFGNRILNQIALFVPVFVSCGGSKEEALDFLFSRKILSKLEGRFEEYIRPGLLELKNLMHELYGTAFTKSEHAIDRMLKRL